MKKGKYERAIGYQSVENTTHAQSGARDTCYRSTRIAVSLRYKVARENRSTNRRCNIGLSKVVTWTPLNDIVVQSYNAKTNKAIGDSRLRRRMRNLAATSGESRWISRYVADSKRASVFDPYVETWRHPQNRKYMTYCIVIRGGPSHGDGQHVQRISWSLNAWFLRCASWKTHRPAQTDTQTRWTQCFARLPTTKYTYESGSACQVRLLLQPQKPWHNRLCRSVHTTTTTTTTTITTNRQRQPSKM